MNEYVLAAIVRLNEAIALLAVEPLNNTCRHNLSLISERRPSEVWSLVTDCYLRTSQADPSITSLYPIEIALAGLRAEQFDTLNRHPVLVIPILPIRRQPRIAR